MSNKIYTSKLGVVVSLTLLFGSWLIAEAGFARYFCLAMFSVISFSVTFHAFYPFIKFGEEGLCVQYFGVSKMKFQWSEIKSIKLISTLMTYITYLNFKSGFMIILIPWLTKDYFLSLSKIIDCLKDKNADFKVDDRVLRILKKYETWTKV